MYERLGKSHENLGKSQYFFRFYPHWISETRAVLHGLLNFCYAGFYTLFQGCIPGCGDCELGLPKYFKIPILCPVNSNTADCIYWRTDFCISHYSWTPEKRLQANQLFSIQERIFDVLWIFIINIRWQK